MRRKEPGAPLQTGPVIKNPKAPGDVFRNPTPSLKPRLCQSLPNAPKGLFVEASLETQIWEPKFRTTVTWCCGHISTLSRAQLILPWGLVWSKERSLQSRRAKPTWESGQSLLPLILDRSKTLSQKHFSLFHELGIQPKLALLRGKLFMDSGNSGFLTDDVSPELWLPIFLPDRIVGKDGWIVHGQSQTLGSLYGSHLTLMSGSHLF